MVRCLLQVPSLESRLAELEKRVVDPGQIAKLAKEGQSLLAPPARVSVPPFESVHHGQRPREVGDHVNVTQLLP